MDSLCTHWQEAADDIPQALQLIHCVSPIARSWLASKDQPLLNDMLLVCLVINAELKKLDFGRPHLKKRPSNGLPYIIPSPLALFVGSPRWFCLSLFVLMGLSAESLCWVTSLLIIPCSIHIGAPSRSRLLVNLEGHTKCL